MSLLLLFQLGGGGGFVPPDPEPEVGQTPAGRRKTHRKYVVEIDGREFSLDSLDEALALLAKAQSLAQLAAEKKAEEAVFERLPRAIHLGKVETVRLQTPDIIGPADLTRELKAARQNIERIYRDAAVTAELRILMALDAEKDDEEAILLSL